LEEAYQNGWLLSTTELAALLKLSKSTVRGYGSQFEDAGFVFTRAGTRKRGEAAWEVGKRRKSNKR
jgi:DNA-binding IclR family transcriptional regulator